MRSVVACFALLAQADSRRCDTNEEYNLFKFSKPEIPLAEKQTTFCCSISMVFRFYLIFLFLIDRNSCACVLAMPRVAHDPLAKLTSMRTK